ncbi:MAG: ATP-dependent 6-phosphofructokinase [Desulfovibrionaceae bacterium]
MDLFAPISSRDTRAPRLGRPRYASPLEVVRFVGPRDDVLVEAYRRLHGRDAEGRRRAPAVFEHAGPRERIYFDPAKTRCAIVTCGGLCPGINNVIRAIVMEAHWQYGVAGILGVRYGLEGFIPAYGHAPLELTPESVTHIHEFGGTVLGTSRGPQDPGAILDTLKDWGVNVLFMIGGDGTMRAADTVIAEAARRRAKVSVIGVPKTIDNDIDFVGRTFGFDTAVGKACEAVGCAHIEAMGVCNGVGVVKVMGRNAGYIAAEATLASRDVNFVLVPEADFDLEGPHGFLEALRARLAAKHHAVVVVAEGAGQRYVTESGVTDASGNPKLGDIGLFLVSAIRAHLAAAGMDHTIKYIDPSYIVRSVPANSTDAVYCGFLGAHSVHAAMSGRTGCMVGQWNGRYVHIPIALATRRKKCINIRSNYWRHVLESTGQPPLLAEG